MATLQKPRDPYRGAVESDKLRGVRPDIVHEPELRRLRRLIEPPDGCMSLIVEGSDAGAGVTSLALKVGAGFAMGVGEPGIPIASPGSLRFVATSWLSTNVPAGQWTLEAWLHRGASSPQQVATFMVNTSNP